jgi:type I restriction enzyme S subunit
MKVETFFEKFELLADVPGAVEKLRELCIHLGIQGALTANEPSEMPVTIEMSGSGSTHVPENWRTGLFGDAFHLEYGENLPAPKRSETGEFPVYGSNGIVGTHNQSLTTAPAIIVGRKGSAGALNISAGPSWTTDVAYFVCPPPEVEFRFAYYLFKTLRLDELGKGIKPGLSRKEAYALPIALPPLPEQRRIVAQVDELMALGDRLEAQQKEREAKHAALSRAALARFAEAPTAENLGLLFHRHFDISPEEKRSAILTMAVRGRLVKQDEHDGHALDQITGALARLQTRKPRPKSL